MSLAAEELARLIERCAGGEGEEADWARLRTAATEPGRRQEIEAELRLTLRLHGLLRAPDPALGDRVLGLIAAQRTGRRQRTLRGVERRLRRRSVTRWWPLAAAALLLLGLGLGLGWPRASVDDRPHCDVGDGAEILCGDRLVPAGGVRLEPGTLVAARAGSARLHWADGSALRLMEGAALRIEDPIRGKRLALTRGRIEAEVAPQAADRPFRLQSPQALVEVLGTRFVLDVGPGLTRLRVDEGRVRLAALSGGEALVVTPGRDAEVPTGGPARWSPPDDPSRRADRLRVVADADACALKLQPDRVQGRAESLMVKLDPPGGQGLTREAFLRFPVAALRGRMQRAWLLLQVTEVPVPTRQAVALVEGDFSEDSLCWNLRPVRGRQLATWMVDRDGPVRIGLGSLQDSGEGDLVLRLYSLDAGNRNLAHYAAREHANPAWRPVLEVELAPEPAAGAAEVPSR